MVRRGKSRRGPHDAESRIPGEVRRLCAGVAELHVALAVDVSHAEAGVDGGLVGIGCWPCQVVEIEARKKLAFFAELLIDANRKLIRICYDIRRRSIGSGSIRARRIIRLRIPRQHGGDLRVHRDGQRVGRAVGVCHHVLACALGRGGHRQHLRCTEDLTESLVLAEVKRLSAAIIYMWQQNGPAVGEPKLVPLEGGNPSRLDDGRIVEVVSGIEGGVPQELKD